MKNIIVGTDFSQGSYAALDIAIDIANHVNADIEVIWVRKEKILFDGDQKAELTRLAEQRLNELCGLKANKLKHTKMSWKILDGKVSSVISDEARANKSFMIVIGTNGASGFEKYLMGSTAVRIVQDSPCPVLTIREGFDASNGLQRIVVPVRVNINSRQKVPHATQIAKLFGSEIYLLGLIANKGDESDIRAYIKQAEAFVTKEGFAFHATMRNYSNYCDTVLEYADEINASTIVINTEQDKVISQLFLGTNAQQIVHKSQIPVLCLHPKDIVTLAK